MFGQNVVRGGPTMQFIVAPRPESGPGERQIEQHHVRFVAETANLTETHVVEVGLDALGGFFTLFRERTDDLGLHRARAGEHVAHRLSVEADHALQKHRMEGPAGIFPRFGALFVLQAEQFQACGVSFAPFAAAVVVIFDLGRDFVAQRLKRALFKQVGQVVLEGQILLDDLGRARKIDDYAAVVRLLDVCRLNFDVQRIFHLRGIANPVQTERVFGGREAGLTSDLSHQ